MQKTHLINVGYKLIVPRASDSILYLTRRLEQCQNTTKPEVVEKLQEFLTECKKSQFFYYVDVTYPYILLSPSYKCTT